MRIQVCNDITNTVVNVALPAGKNPVRIGSGPRNDVRLPSNLVPDEAAAISNAGDGQDWQFWPMSDGCALDEHLLMAQRPIPVRNRMVVQLSPFTLTIFLEPHDSLRPEDVQHQVLDARAAGLVNEIHRGLLTSPQLLRDGPDEILSPDYMLRLELAIEDLVAGFDELPRDDFTPTELGNHFAGQLLRSQVLRRIIEQSDRGGGDPPNLTPWSQLMTAQPTCDQEVSKWGSVLQSNLGMVPAGEDLSRQVQRFEAEFWPAWRAVRESVRVDLRRYMFLAQIKKDIKDIWYGLGPLEDLLENPTVTEIMVNDAEHIFIEKDGIIENSGRRFVKDLTDIIQRIVTRVNRKIDTSMPLVDARLADGSRVNAVIKPLTVGGPCLTIRRFPQRAMTCEDLVRRGSLSESVRNFLQACVQLRCNILVAGGTGTGKTTLLNALSGFIPDKERIITIEDTAELRLAKTHVVSLEAKQKNVEGTGAIDIRMLVKNALRMRPDRIVVGECRGGEALDMLQAMNTGHDGSMTTIHANSPADVLLRLEVMVQQNADSQLPVASIHRQVASALDLIIQLQAETVADPHRPGERVRRRVTSEIVEVVDVDAVRGGLYLKPIFRRLPGSGLQPTGFLPGFIEELLDSGLDMDLFLNLASHRLAS
jgi:Flp pilus assembly CpaF family ATPase